MRWIGTAVEDGKEEIMTSQVNPSCIDIYVLRQTMRIELNRRLAPYFRAWVSET